MKLKMIDTEGGHYGIILETQKRKNVLYLKDALSDELGDSSLRTNKKKYVLSNL